MPQPLAVDDTTGLAPGADAQAYANDPNTQAALARFDAARQAFLAGQYPAALEQVDQAIRLLPGDPNLHQFRALVLFALGRYQEEAATLYAVLAVGPGWDWQTVRSFYPDDQTYVAQLRLLEAAVRANPQDPALVFDLAYQYLVLGGPNGRAAAARTLGVLVTLRPAGPVGHPHAATAPARGGTRCPGSGVLRPRGKLVARSGVSPPRGRRAARLHARRPPALEDFAVRIDSSGIRVPYCKGSHPAGPGPDRAGEMDRSPRIGANGSPRWFVEREASLGGRSRQHSPGRGAHPGLTLTRTYDMAASQSVDRQTFLSHLRSSGLVPEGTLRSASLPDTNRGRLVARALVESGLLTRFQAERLLAGRTAGFLLGQYRILDQIGRGGMGRVFKAEHLTMQRIVALKVLSPGLVDNERAHELFLREVRAAAQLVYPNIVTAYDANQIDGRYFLVMEYVDGLNLDQLVRKQGPLSVGLACDYVRQVAIGLQRAHALGMVHRDIKPANILAQRHGVSEDSPGLVKISDFGLARLQTPGAATHSPNNAGTILTRDNTVMGTPDYLSPEQSRSLHKTDIRSDLYSLGCTFYFLLTGQVPFPGGNSLEKLIRHSTETCPIRSAARPPRPPRPGRRHRDPPAGQGPPRPLSDAQRPGRGPPEALRRQRAHPLGPHARRGLSLSRGPVEHPAQRRLQRRAGGARRGGRPAERPPGPLADETPVPADALTAPGPQPPPAPHRRRRRQDLNRGLLVVAAGLSLAILGLGLLILAPHPAGLSGLASRRVQKRLPFSGPGICINWAWLIHTSEVAAMTPSPVPLSARIGIAAPHVTSLPSPYGIGDLGPGRLRLAGDAGPLPPDLVADPAPGPDRLRRLPLLGPVRLRRQRLPAQPGPAARGWVARPRRPGPHPVRRARRLGTCERLQGGPAGQGLGGVRRRRGAQAA